MAEPSRSTRAGWEPTVCYLCDKRIYVSGQRAEGAMFSFRGGRPRSRHADCLRVRLTVERLDAL